MIIDDYLEKKCELDAANSDQPSAERLDDEPWLACLGRSCCEDGQPTFISGIGHDRTDPQLIRLVEFIRENPLGSKGQKRSYPKLIEYEEGMIACSKDAFFHICDIASSRGWRDFTNAETPYLTMDKVNAILGDASLVFARSAGEAGVTYYVGSQKRFMEIPFARLSRRDAEIVNRELYGFHRDDPYTSSHTLEHMIETGKP